MVLRFAIACVLALSGPLFAQVQQRHLCNGFGENDSAGGTMIAIRSSGTATVIENGATSSEVYSFGCGVVSPRDFYPLSATDLLIVGANTIERWSRSGSAYSLVDQASVNMSLEGVTYDASSSMLYLLDSLGKTVKRAQWSPSSPLAGLSTQTWATVSSVPALASAANYFLRFLSAGTVGGFAQVFLVDADSLPHAQTGVLLGTGGIPTNITFQLVPGAKLSPPTVAESASIDEQELSEGGSSVVVRGLPGVAFSVVNTTTNTVLATAQLGASGSATVALPAPVAIGNLYAIAPIGGSPTQGLVAIAGRRYGTPESFANGALLQRMLVPRTAHVDSPNFQVRISVSLNGTLASDLSLYGVMGIGLRSGSADPVVPYGSNYLLNSFLMLNAYGYIMKDAPSSGYASSGLALPNDPALAGLVLFVQFGFLDGADIRLSEVLGFELAG